MRKVKATLGLLVLSGALAAGSSAKMNYAYGLSKAEQHEAGLVLALAAVVVCAGFIGPAAIACGVAAAL